MSRFFYHMEYLLTIDFSNFDSSAMTKMDIMFTSCVSLTEITWGDSFSTSKVTSMWNLFNNCRIKYLDVSKFDTSKVTTFSYMFAKCENIEKLNLQNFDTSNVTDFGRMFSG